VGESHCGIIHRPALSASLSNREWAQIQNTRTLSVRVYGGRGNGKYPLLQSLAYSASNCIVATGVGLADVSLPSRKIAGRGSAVTLLWSEIPIHLPPQRLLHLWRSSDIVLVSIDLDDAIGANRILNTVTQTLPNHVPRMYIIHKPNSCDKVPEDRQQAEVETPSNANAVVEVQSKSSDAGNENRTGLDYGGVLSGKRGTTSFEDPYLSFEAKQILVELEHYLQSEDMVPFLWLSSLSSPHSVGYPNSSYSNIEELYNRLDGIASGSPALIANFTPQSGRKPLFDWNRFRVIVAVAMSMSIVVGGVAIYVFALYHKKESACLSSDNRTVAVSPAGSGLKQSVARDFKPGKFQSNI